MTTPQQEADRDALRAHFGRELRRLRERADLSLGRLAQALGCTPQWIHQLEMTDKSVSKQTALDLDTYFKTEGWEDEDGHFHRLYVTLRRAGQRRVLLPGFDAYLRHEGKAIGVRCFAAQVVPGLLQTEDYARGVMLPEGSVETTDARVAGRIERQAILNREKPPTTLFVLDESVLRRPVGGSRVMVEQIDRLLDLMRSPQVDLRVLPLGRVTPAGLEGGFILLSFGGDSDLMYVESAAVSQLVEDRGIVFNASVRFDLIMGEALSQNETVDLMNRTREEYREALGPDGLAVA